MRVFEASNVKKHFEGVVALKNANLKVERFKVCGLVGANGSGKSTFSKICSGLLKPDSAEISIDGKDVSIGSYKKADELKISLVHQNLSLVPDLTVWENIVLGKENSFGKIFLNNRIDKESAFETIANLIEDDIPLSARVSSLSPSQKMIVEITKALFRNPELLILDEPTAALEYKQVEQLFRKVEQLKKRGILLVFISHRIWEIIRICDVVFAFRNGEMVGTVDFDRQPRDERLILPLVTGDEEIGYCLEKKSRNFSLGRSQVNIKAENLSLRTNLRNVSFEAKEGEILGIGGLNGQGQEELMRVLSGALRPTVGRIFLRGEEKKITNVNRTIRNGIYFVPGDRQRDGLFMSNDVFFNIIMPSFPLRKASFSPNFRVLEDITENIIKKTAISPQNRKMTVNNLSGGNQQKVVFGKWLQFEPTVLLLNDPAKGIDIGAMRYLYKLIHELAENGTTVILYASSNEELICNCDRVLVMFEGAIVKELSDDEITDGNLIQYSLRITV